MADGKSKSSTVISDTYNGIKFNLNSAKQRRPDSDIYNIKAWCYEKNNPGDKKLKGIDHISGKDVLKILSDQNVEGTIHNYDFTKQVLNKVFSKSSLDVSPESQFIISVCPTMADQMKLEISSNLAFLNNEEYMGKSGGLGTAAVRIKTGETDEDKRIRQNNRDQRFRRECEYLNSLSQEQLLLLNDVLVFIETTPSTWIVNLFKVASSTRSRELSQKYNEAEMAFEIRTNSWSEIWRHPDLKIKIYEAMGSIFRKIPTIIQHRLENIAQRIKVLRDHNSNPV